MNDGKQPAKVVDMQFGTASTGNDQVALTFEIVDGPDRGSNITWFGTFSEKGAKWALEGLAKCGAPQNKGLDELSVDDLGSLVELVVAYEADQKTGKPHPRVKFINRPGSHGGFKMKHTLDPAAMRLLAAKQKAAFDQTKRYEAIPIPEPTSPTASDSNSGPPPSADGDPGAAMMETDIPF